MTTNYFYAVGNIEQYLGILGGIGLILTAIIHPEGIAPYFQPSIRYLGNWIVSAVPGARTLATAYVGRQRQLLNVVFVVLLAGTAFWLYNLDDTIVDNNLAWGLLTGVLVWLILLAVASRLGRISPTFAEAARTWAPRSADSGRRPGRLCPRLGHLAAA